MERPSVEPPLLLKGSVQPLTAREPNPIKPAYQDEAHEYDRDRSPPPSQLGCGPSVLSFMGAEEDMDELLGGFSSEVGATARELCEVMRASCPGATETVQLGWKAGSYSRGGVMKGAICAICPQSKWVNVQFLQGTSLKDPDGLLEGSGKTMRHVKVRSIEGMDMDALRALVLQADGLVN